MSIEDRKLAPVRLSPEALAQALAAEAGRIAAIKAAATAPEVCGPDIPVAPARGAFQVFRPIEIVPGSAGSARHAGYQGRGEDRPRSGLRRADVFDVMEAQARRAHAARSEDAGPFVAPLTPGQIAMGRIYRDLCERHEKGGLKCASLEAGRAGGNGGGFMDAFLQEGRTIDRLRARVGAGVAMSVRRVRPSRRGKEATGIITDLVLVDRVCLRGQSLSEVLRAFGWAKKAEHVQALRKALAAALDRMQGYDLHRTAR